MNVIMMWTSHLACVHYLDAIRYDTTNLILSQAKNGTVQQPTPLACS